MVQLIREFRPDVVVSFGPDGGYGHPDHIAISAAATAACQQAGTPRATLASGRRAGSPPAGPAVPQLLSAPRRAAHEPAGHLADDRARPVRRDLDFVHSLLLMAEEAGTMGFIRDHAQVRWYPPGCYVVEQGEAPRSCS